MVNINLKQIGLQLCTCTWVEIMTGVGITLYLLLVTHSHLLAVLTMGLFAPLIGFHFIITRISKKEEAREQQE
jgi:chromate transport protein ChrA